MLDALVYHQDDVTIRRHHTDGGGDLEHVFALCTLLGFQFAPRIPDLKHRRIYSFAKPSDYPTLEPLIAGRINVELIRAHWAEILRIVASIRAGAVAPSVIMRQLASYPRQNGVAAALRELGRMERTLFTLDWVEDPELRRETGQELNKGESRNSLAHAVFIHRLGEIRDRTYENQQHRASGLNLIVTAIILWNTRYLERAVATLRQTENVPRHLLAHLSPLGWEHINLTGDYIWIARQDASENHNGLRCASRPSHSRRQHDVHVPSPYAYQEASWLVPARALITHRQYVSRVEAIATACGQARPCGLFHLLFRPTGHFDRIEYMSRWELRPMANINLERRAEIGREKRARTRLQLMAAAKALFSKRPWEAVTIDEVVQEARVAKGTFYSHFNDLEELAAAVADELIDAFDEMIQPERQSISDPLFRIAFGCDAFLRQSLSDRPWASLATRMAASHPAIGQRVRDRLSDDLRNALDKSPQAGLTPQLGVEVIVGLVLQVAAAIGDGRLDDHDRPEAIRCMLATIGVGRRDATSIIARLARVSSSVPRDILKGRSPAGGSPSAGESV